MDKSIIIDDQKITYCIHTGLIYVDEVPFTKETLNKLQDLFQYGKNDLKGQFDFNVQVIDHEGELSMVYIDSNIIKRIKKFIVDENVILYLASNKDF